MDCTSTVSFGTAVSRGHHARLEVVGEPGEDPSAVLALGDEEGVEAPLARDDRGEATELSCVEPAGALHRALETLVLPLEITEWLEPSLGEFPVEKDEAFGHWQLIHVRDLREHVPESEGQVGSYRLDAGTAAK